VVVRGPSGGADITSRQRGGALLLLVAVLVGEGGGLCWSLNLYNRVRVLVSMFRCISFVH